MDGVKAIVLGRGLELVGAKGKCFEINQLLFAAQLLVNVDSHKL